MNIADILERAADLIEPKGAWCQCAMATDKNGRALTDGYDCLAVCWCGQGAVEAILEHDLIGASDIDLALDELVGGDFAVWNDALERTQQEVVQALRDAARRARQEGARA